jgi:catechol 2,3-dioxygenase-like lactoylglutathione lyase family enzyme
MNVENTIPVLRVKDVPASIRFYREVLGFSVDWGGGGEMAHIASVSRNGHAIMMTRGEAAPGCVWIGGEILYEVWQKVRLEEKARVVQRPTNQPWALEMRIADPDGNILWFGTESLKDVPFGGELADGQLGPIK